MFRIRRYNGDSHEHTNKIEGESIDGFHIHTATERYQEKGFQPEGYATPTNKYSDWQSAFKLMLNENNIKIETDKIQKRVQEYG